MSLAVGEGTTAALAIGGKGGGGGDGDTVDVVSTGANLQTSGDRSFGILAQSVGGGGGNGGFAIAGALSIASPSWRVRPRRRRVMAAAARKTSPSTAAATSPPRASMRTACSHKASVAAVAPAALQSPAR